MPQDYTLLVDDQDSAINYICPSLKQQVLPGSYSNNTWTTLKDGSCKKGWFEYTFYGTGIIIHVPTAEPAESAAVLLDNVLFKPNQGGHFESLNLTDEKHTFTYGIGEVLSTPVFDYLTITAGPSTPLNGRTLIVDDSDSSVTYNGNWKNSPPSPLSFDYSTSLHRDTAHWSSTVGDTVDFQFIGSSVSVFGLTTNVTSGNITTSYIVDGATARRTISRGTFDSVPMTELFHADLEPGTHTLTINLTEIAASQSIGIDFIAYNSSVNSVTSLPGYELATGNVTPKTEEPVHHSSSPKYAILGGVLGGVGFLFALGLVFLIWRRRHSNPAVRLASRNNSHEDIGVTEQQPQMSEARS